MLLRDSHDRNYVTRAPRLVLCGVLQLTHEANRRFAAHELFETLGLVQVEPPHVLVAVDNLSETGAVYDVLLENALQKVRDETRSMLSAKRDEKREGVTRDRPASFHSRALTGPLPISMMGASGVGRCNHCWSVLV